MLDAARDHLYNIQLSMHPHVRRIIEFLSRKEHYPHPVQAILHRETHVSHVFLAGSFAYKLKKPVTFRFLTPPPWRSAKNSVNLRYH